LISRLHNLSFEQCRERFFKPLEAIVVLRVDKRSGDYVYEARHSYIADTVYERVVKSQEERFDNIVRIINKLNPSYSYDLEVIGKILRAETLEANLSDHAKIRQVYDSAQFALGERAILYHQRKRVRVSMPCSAFATRLAEVAPETGPAYRLQFVASGRMSGIDVLRSLPDAAMDVAVGADC